jgi:hypothetical protein
MTTWTDLQNIHKGETAVIIGNGPSLNDVPLSFLRKYPTFGSNRIYLLKRFTPTYYSVINPRVIVQYLEDIKRQKSETKFIRVEYIASVPGSLPIRSLKSAAFSYDLIAGMYEGWTVTFVNLQIAYWMGFTRVLLVGLDHRYEVDKPLERHSRLRGGDPNHFDPNYFRDAEWDHPNLQKSAEAYQLALAAYSNDGREIINVSTESDLIVFPRRDWIDYA